MIRRLLLGLSLAVVLAACGTPTVLQVTDLVPADGATDVSIDAAVSATFNLALDPDTVDGAFTLASTGGAVAGVVAYDAPSRTATFTPDAPLAYATEYTGTVAGSVATTGGVALGGAASWSFTTEAAAPAIGGIDVTPAEANVAIAGEVQLTATPTGVVGNPDLTVTWSSSAETIATVDATGLVTGVATGTATITATSDFDGSITGTAAVTVGEPDPAIGGIDVTPAEDTLAISGQTQLTATPTGVVGNPDLTVTWSSSAETIATVDATGLVTGVATGTATITATSDFDGSITGTAAITVVAPMAGTLENYVLTLDAGTAITALEPDFTGGAAPFTYTLLALDLTAADPINGLPPGVVLDGDTGTISGTPTQAGFWRAAIEVTDSVGQTLEIWAEIDVSLVLQYASTTYGYAPDATGVVVPSTEVTVVGADGTLSFSMALATSDPAGDPATTWSIDATSGAISRVAVTTITTTWTYLVTVLDDGTNETATFAVTLTQSP